LIWHHLLLIWHHLLLLHYTFSATVCDRFAIDMHDVFAIVNNVFEALMLS
jgi:hypothetical protein